MVSTNDRNYMARVLASALVVAVSGILCAPAWAQNTQPNVQIQAYQVASEKLDNLSSVLKQAFDAGSGVTVSADKSTGQLIVTAPAETQRQIGEFVKKSGYQVTPRVQLTSPSETPQPTTMESAELRVRSQPQPNLQRQAQTPKSSQPNASATKFQRTRDLGDGMVELEIQLNNLKGETLEKGITKLVGQRIPVSFSAEGALVIMTLPTNTNKKVSLQVYRNDQTAILRGEQDAARSWAEVIRAMDTPSHSDEFRTSLVAFRNAERDDVEKALDPLRDAENSLAKRQVFEALKGVAGNKKLRWSGDMAAMIFQPESEEAAEDEENAAQIIGQPAGQQPIDIPPAADPNNPQFTITPEEDGGLIGPVQIEFLEGLDVIVVRGHARDVARITKIINDIEQLSVETRPVINIVELEHANSEAVATIINELYEEMLNTRYGQVSIVALNKPNAILLIGREQSVLGIEELIQKLDTPVGPSKSLRVFQLKYLSAADAQTELSEFYEEPTALGTRVRISADIRSNALIVSASPRDMAEVEVLIKQLDVPQSESSLQMRIVQLKNSAAVDLAPVLQEAITGISTGTGNQQNQTANQVRQAMIDFMTIDAEGKQAYQSGILREVQITADERSNSLIVKAPENGIELVLAVIKQLDSQPSAESQIKVFTIVNGDATQLSNMLNELFQTAQSANSQAQQANPFFFGGAAAGAGESSLIPLNFSVDTRTNSIVASGSASALTVVEAILLRLDQDEASERKMTVVRLLNARADLVADSLSAVLDEQRQLQTLDPSVVSPFQQLVRDVIVVPELFTNSLIISATPQYFDQVLDIVRDLDARPPMVMLQVLIADVRLGDTEEFGIEVGLQDSLLFDRSVVSSGELDPGFNFNNQPLGNSSSAASLATAGAVGSQGLTNFALGRTSDLGYGGFVFSAASESVNVLVRALERESRLEVLARPHIQTMDNQPGFIQVGQRVPYITSTQQTNFGTVNSTELINTGIILSVTPRVSPDGTVVMALQAERSATGSDADGVPISINQNGDVIRSPRIDTQTATAVVSARSGQTIVFGGLINNSVEVENRQVPLIGDIPLVGRFFRYDRYDAARSELLIIITPIVVRTEADANMLREQEMCRMSWCLADVADVYGTEALAGLDPSLPTGCEIMTINPDENPTGFPAGMPQMYQMQPGGPQFQGMPQAEPIPPGQMVPPGMPQTNHPPFRSPMGPSLRPANLEAPPIRPVGFEQRGNNQAAPPQQPGPQGYFAPQPPQQQPVR